MFAAATREVVFSNPEVVRSVNAEFIPVALKAAQVNNPPAGAEGALYAEIGRSKPAPQGVCTVNSDGKVLAWALSFDDEASIVKFLDHVAARYKQAPDARKPVTAERFMKFPSRPLADVEDHGRRVQIPERHADGQRCPAEPAAEEGALLGQIIGRPLDDNGKPVADTTRQEHYMEARFEMPLAWQRQLAAAATVAGREPFRIPDAFARALVGPAFLGQLDVNPLGDVPGSRNDRRQWQFTGQAVSAPGERIVRIRIDGESDVAGSQARGGKPRSDGRLWEHRVTLRWHGYVDIDDERVTQLLMIAAGNERLRWGNQRFKMLTEPDAAHLMAGHPIDLNCAVRYGLLARPVAERPGGKNHKTHERKSNGDGDREH